MNLWLKALLVASIIEVPALAALAVSVQSDSGTGILGGIASGFHLLSFLIVYKAKLHWEPVAGPWLPRIAYWAALYIMQVFLMTPLVFIALRLGGRRNIANK